MAKKRGTPADQGQNRGKPKSKPRPPPPEGQRFKKGVSGNPTGRPKGRSITGIIRALLDADTIPDPKVPGGKRKLADGKRIADILAEQILAAALAGKFPFVKEILDRHDGRIPDRTVPPAAEERPRLIIPDTDDRPRSGDPR